MLRQIPVKLTPSFEDALGYPRGFRWVSFYWEPCGDELMYDDGYCSTEGHWYGFQQFTHHPKVRPWLDGYNLGSSDEEATHRLLCDLETREVYVGEVKEVIEFLAAEVAKFVPAGAPKDAKIVLSAEDMRELAAKMISETENIRMPTMEEIQEAMRKEDEAIKKMVLELGD